MESILGLAKTEGMLFKYGSGTGTNLSPIRRRASCSRGAGPPRDRSASCVASTLRRRHQVGRQDQARPPKMVILNIDHPDIEDFNLVQGQGREEGVDAHDAGYDGSFDGEAVQVDFSSRTRTIRCA